MLSTRRYCAWTVLLLLPLLSCTESDSPSVPVDVDAFFVLPESLALVECDSVVEFTVFRSIVAGACSVRVELGSGTATHGEDFVFSDQVLAFSDGEGSRVFEVAILDDSVVENMETIVLIVSGEEEQGRLGDPKRGVLRIEDDEPNAYDSTIYFPLELGNWWRYSGGFCTYTEVDSGWMADCHGYEVSATIDTIEAHGDEQYSSMRFTGDPLPPLFRRRMRQDGQYLWTLSPLFAGPGGLQPDDLMTQSMPWLLVDFAQGLSVNRVLFQTPPGAGEPYITVTTTNLGRISDDRFGSVHRIALFYSAHYITSPETATELLTLFIADSVGIIAEDLWRDYSFYDAGRGKVVHGQQEGYRHLTAFGRGSQADQSDNTESARR